MVSTDTLPQAHEIGQVNADTSPASDDVHPIRQKLKEGRATALNIYGMTCYYCAVELAAGRSAKNGLTWDHVMPRCKGGDQLGWRNLVPACKRCNGAKGDLLLEEYRLVCYEKTEAGRLVQLLQASLADSGSAGEPMWDSFVAPLAAALLEYVRGRFPLPVFPGEKIQKNSGYHVPTQAAVAHFVIAPS